MVNFPMVVVLYTLIELFGGTSLVMLKSLSVGQPHLMFKRKLFSQGKEKK